MQSNNPKVLAMKRRSLNELRVLSTELEQLSKVQEDALKTAVYLPMTPEESRLFAERRDRIKELREILTRLKAS